MNLVKTKETITTLLVDNVQSHVVDEQVYDIRSDAGDSLGTLNVTPKKVTLDISISVNVDNVQSAIETLLAQIANPV